MKFEQAQTLLRRRNSGATFRRRVVLRALERPRTQTELRNYLGMSNSGTLHLLRRMESEGLVRAVQRVGWTQVWERRTNTCDTDTADESVTGKT
ncbi:winged helix-turn-helix domain-containing protein [Yoonia sp.]|uniref:winged helix-turn-helix domain-containing protein n=1 Tax=Yoonia sp. TaxID=2212373 RepID=UPI0019EF725A|nr:winged helix-turn-helix domain-containing protein [Yoonia sp.]MBE0413531.1 winged helix-turn-helix transcriptional regulator [Yoonia sp.]